MTNNLNFDGVAIKVQAIKVSITEYKVKEVIVEEVYVGRLSAEVLSFLWSKNLEEKMYRERILAFYKFLDHDLSRIVPYFTLLPEQSAFDTSYEVNEFEENEEYFSSHELYMKIPKMSYNSKLKFNGIPKLMNVNEITAKYSFEVKAVQVLISDYIKGKVLNIWNSNIQAFKNIAKDIIKEIITEIGLSIEELQLCVRDEIKKSQVLITSKEIYIMLFNALITWISTPNIKVYIDSNYVHGDEIIIWPLNQPNIEYLLELILIAKETEILYKDPDLVIETHQASIEGSSIRLLRLKNALDFLIFGKSEDEKVVVSY